VQRVTLFIAVGVLDDCDRFARGVSQRRVLSGAYCGVGLLLVATMKNSHYDLYTHRCFGTILSHPDNSLHSMRGRIMQARRIRPGS
jgi:hypothetical protein